MIISKDFKRNLGLNPFLKTKGKSHITQNSTFIFGHNSNEYMYDSLPIPQYNMITMQCNKIALWLLHMHILIYFNFQLKVR